MIGQKGRARPPYREPLDAVVGLIAGILWGIATGLGAGLYLLEGSLVLLGAGVAASAVVFGVLGYYKGDDFFRWVRDHWFLG